MQPYKTKWLEILAIEEHSDAHFMLVKLVDDQTTTFKWVIDPFTAGQLRELIGAAAPSVKYRLSLSSDWSPVDQQHYGFLTQYDRQSSKKMKLPCSESFAGQLTLIKDLNHVNDLSSLSSFIHPDAEEQTSAGPTAEVLEPEPAGSGEARPSIPANKPAYRYSKMAVALLIVAVFIVVSLAGSSLIYQRVSAISGSKVLSAAKANEMIPVEIKTKKLIQPVLLPEPDTDAKTVEPEQQEPEQADLPAVSLNKLVNYSVPKGSVAITIDDGPSKYTKDIVDVLKRYQVGATFFFVGTQVNKFPESVKYVHENGFAIGNHSMTHSDLKKLPADKQRAEIQNTNKLIQDITSEPVVLFRPPYGSLNDTTKQLVSQEQMKIALWNRDTEDWKKGAPQKILTYIETTKPNGTVILLHESKKTLTMLPQIIEYLQNQNLEISSLM